MKKYKIFCAVVWFAYLLCILYITSACSTKRQLTSSQTIKDSTWVKKTVIPVDTTITVPANKAQVSALLKDLQEGKPVQSKSKNLTASLTRVGDKIIADCDVEELQMIITLQKELLEVYRSRETTTSTEETVVETLKQTPWYLVPFLWLGVGAALYIIFRLIKSYFIPVKKV